MLGRAAIRSSEMSGWRKRLKSTRPFTPRASSLATKWASELKYGESLTATGMETVFFTSATASR